MNRAKSPTEADTAARPVMKSPEYATLGQIETWLGRNGWYVAFRGKDHKTYCKGHMELRVPQHKLTNRESFDIAYNIVLQYERESTFTRYGLGVLLDDLKQTYDSNADLEEAS